MNCAPAGAGQWSSNAVDVIPALSGLCVTGGRLNLAKLLSAADVSTLPQALAWHRPNYREPLINSPMRTPSPILLSNNVTIFSGLKKSGIVKSVKGPGGGYLLGKDRDEITVAEIIKAIGEPIKMTRCTKVQKSCVNSGTKCKTHHLWHGLENKIYEYLNSISLKDVCK